MLIIIIVQDYFDDNYCHIFYDNNCAKFVQDYVDDYYAKSEERVAEEVLNSGQE